MFDEEKIRINQFPRELLSKEEAARALGIKTKVLDQIIKRELIQSYKIGRYRVFKREFLLEFIELLQESTEDTFSRERQGFIG